MRSVVTILTLTLAAQPGRAAEASPPPASQVATTVAVERIVLPRLRGTVALRVDALGAAVELHAPKDLRRLHAGLAAAVSAGTICPKVEVRSDAVVLRCRTGQLQAVLVTASGRRHLDLRELRGLPWSGDADAFPAIGYDPERLQLGGPCPGTTPAGRGECAYAAGRLDAAARYFQEALTSSHREIAALRLGDLALRRGDPTSAAQWFRSAGSSGPVGRLAAARLCELLGACLREPGFAGVFEPASLPEPLRTEMELRGARAHAFMGRFAAAARALAQRLEASDRPPPCTGAENLCRRLALAALREDGTDSANDALALYLALPAHLRESSAVVLAEAAATKAAAVGAPLFGANLLAATVGHASAGNLGEHLLRTAELYLAGGDPARARVVVEFARTRLRRAALAGPRWTAVVRGASAAPPATANSVAEAAAKDLARALAATARARAHQAADEPGGVP